MLGQLINNPFNIKWSPLYEWKGAIGKEKGFVRFSSMDYGVRAAILLLRTYVRSGVINVWDIIHRYAPPIENNTNSYFKYIVERTGLKDRVYSVDDVLTLLSAMAFIESRYEVTVDQLRLIMRKFHISENNFFINPLKHSKK